MDTTDVRDVIIIGSGPAGLTAAFVVAGLSAYRQLRGDQIAMVYQDPTQALNPSLKLGRQLTEVLTTHQEVPLTEGTAKQLKLGWRD